MCLRCFKKCIEDKKGLRCIINCISNRGEHEEDTTKKHEDVSNAEKQVEELSDIKSNDTEKDVSMLLIDESSMPHQKFFQQNVTDFCDLYFTVCDELTLDLQENIADCKALLEKILQQFRNDYKIIGVPTEADYLRMANSMARIIDTFSEKLKHKEEVAYAPDKCWQYIDSDSCLKNTECMIVDKKKHKYIDEPVFCHSKDYTAREEKRPDDDRITRGEWYSPWRMWIFRDERGDVITTNPQHKYQSNQEFQDAYMESTKNYAKPMYRTYYV
jgi:hypothetical protein